MSFKFNPSAICARTIISQCLVVEKLFLIETVYGNLNSSAPVLYEMNNII